MIHLTSDHSNERRNHRPRRAGKKMKTNYVREGNGAIQMCCDKIRKTLTGLNVRR